MRSKELDNTAVPLPFEIFATMKTVQAIILLLLLTIACNKDPLGSVSMSGSPDILRNVPLTNTLWDSLAIESHPWKNSADYDHVNSRWIVRDDSSETSEFVFTNKTGTGGTVTVGDGTPWRWSCFPESSIFGIRSTETEYYSISVIGKDYFILSSSHFSRCFSYKLAVDTSRVVILDTTNQSDDPDILLPWPWDD